MNVTIRTVRKNKPKTKHTWTESEDRVCTYLYLNGKQFQDAHICLPHIPIRSIKMKFQNCLFLDKGNVKNSLYKCSKQNIRVFHELREILCNNI